ncbi:MAG: hypothetical protein ABEI31_10715 [Halodesulfurarchaeum sp.]
MSHPRPRPTRRTWLLAISYGLFAYGIHKIGVILGYYRGFFWFQLLTHFLSASALALLLLLVGRTLSLSPSSLVVFVLAGSAVGAVGWEVVEYLGVVPWLIWWGPTDSLLDLTNDLIGIVVVLALHRVRGRTFRPTDSSSTPTAPSVTPGD